ncbi:MAG: type II secretion system protein GspJ [Spirochaetota bacterium]
MVEKVKINKKINTTPPVKKWACLCAFTLIELLVSLSILSVIAGISSWVLVSVRKAGERNQRNEQMWKDIRGFLEQLDSELSSAVYIRDYSDSQFLAQLKEWTGQEATSLSFTTVLPQKFLELGKRGEIVRVEYRVERSQEDLQVMAVKKYVYYQLFSDNPEPVSYTIGDQFTSFRMRFNRNGRWYETWDARQMNMLPDGVELVFSIGDNTFKQFFNIYMDEL